MVPCLVLIGGVLIWVATRDVSHVRVCPVFAIGGWMRACVLWRPSAGVRGAATESVRAAPDACTGRVRSRLVHVVYTVGDTVLLYMRCSECFPVHVAQA